MLKKFIYWLQSLRCHHHWEVYKEHTVAIYEDTVLMFHPGWKHASYHLHKIVLRCSKCGDFKTFTYKA